MTTIRPLRVGMIGANWGIVGHLPAWRNLPDVEVSAICTAHDDTAKAAAAAHGIPHAYSDYRKMIDEAPVDIIDIGTRPALRYDMVMHALAAGKHVLNANPFAPDLRRAEEIKRAQHAAGTVGMVEAQFQWLPQFRHMRSLVVEGFLGDLIGVEVRCHFPLVRDGDALFPFVARPGYTSNYSWLGMAGEGASALRNLGGHCLHALLYLFGDADNVSARLSRGLRNWSFEDGSRFVPETVDTAFVTLGLGQGATAQMNICWSVAGARGFALEAFGTHGRLRIEAPTGFPDATNARLFAAPAGPREGLGREETAVAVPSGLFQLDGHQIAAPEDGRVTVPMTLMLSDMVAAIREGRGCSPGFDQALKVQAICEAAEESNRTGTRVPLIPPSL